MLEEAISNYKGLFIASAGNESNNNDTDPMYPASYNCSNIISVASTDEWDKLSQFSNYGKNSVDIAAPGSDIVSTSLNGSYITMNGTSMASPYIAGVAALVKSQHPEYTTAQIKEAILNSAEYIPALTGSVTTSGRVNALYAVSPRPTPTSVRILNSDRISLDINQTYAMNVSVLPAGSNQAVTWKSSKPDIVYVTEEGIVTGLKAGTAVITATSMVNPALNASIAVTATSVDSDAILFLDMNFKQAVVDMLKANFESIYDHYTIESNIFRADAQKLRQLVVSGMSVKNTEGLQYFVNLEYFDCSNNLLTELDISNNIALKQLICDNNLLTKLDVRKNTELEMLVCYKNRLTELDVSNNTALEDLRCYDSQITKLDVSNNTALVYLECHDNPLKRIDADFKGDLITVIANGLGTVNLKYMNDNRSVNAAQLESKPADFISWTETGQVLSTNLYYDLQVGRDYYLVANFSGNVGQYILSHISLNKTTLSLSVNESKRLIPIILPDNATDESVVWSVNDETVATVDANGTVTAVDAGTAIVTATSVADNKKQATCTVIIETTALLGDINSDSNVDMRDVMYLARYLALWDGYYINENVSDVNKDGKVNMQDVTYLARCISEWSGYSL